MGAAIRGGNVQRDPYLVVFPVVSLNSEWVPCSVPVNGMFFQELSDEEKREWTRKLAADQKPPAPYVAKLSAREVDKLEMPPPLAPPQARSGSRN